MLASDEEEKVKYVRVEMDGRARYGVMADGCIEIMEGTPFDDAMRMTGTKIEKEGARLLAPTPFSKAVCIGLNYRDHAEEFGLPIPQAPVVFLKPSTSAAAPGEDIIYPAMCHRLDYEAELAVVIGRRAKDVAEKDALDYVLGYTIANDVTARDLQPKNGQWTIAKGFDTFMPLGPCISDEVDPGNLMITSRVNGETKQLSNTSNLIFPVPYLISYLSHVMTLLPGDVISTGTPGGISGMQRGDIVEIEIEGLGVLRNGIG